MRHHQGNRARLGGALVAVALAALALLALPAIGTGNDADTTDAHRAAGKIESFDRQTGLLVVNLFKGRKIAGIVVRHRTQVRCPDRRRWHRLRRKHRQRDASATDSATPRDRVVDADRPTDARTTDDDVRTADDDAESREAPESGGDAAEDPAPVPDRSRHCLRHLVPGAIVLRAEMVLAYGDAFFKRIAVLPPPAVVTSESATR
jgi:hypothetical protein